MSSKGLGFSVAVLCISLLAIASSDAGAKQIYRSVGPDGKVTYSDTPPPAAETTEPAAVAGKDKTAPSPSIELAAAYGTKSALPTLKTTSEATTNAPAAARPSAEVEGAVVGVLGIEDLVRQMEVLCTSALPTSYARYTGAADGWRSRNAVFVTKAHQVLTAQFDTTARQHVQSLIRQNNSQTFAPVSGASTNAKIGWCDKSTDEVKAGTLDVNGNPKLAGPLMR